MQFNSEVFDCSSSLQLTWRVHWLSNFVFNPNHPTAKNVEYREEKDVSLLQIYKKKKFTWSLFKVTVYSRSLRKSSKDFSCFIEILVNYEPAFWGSYIDGKMNLINKKGNHALSVPARPIHRIPSFILGPLVSPDIPVIDSIPSSRF